MTTQPRPEGVTWVSPYLTVKDADLAVDFYENAFKFEKRDMVPGQDGTTWHAEVKYKDQLLMLGKEGVWGGKTLSPQTSKIESPMNLYLYCEDVDAFYKHAVAHGAESVGQPEDMFWGDRMCRLQDPDGYVWCFATFKGEHK